MAASTHRLRSRGRWWCALLMGAALLAAACGGEEPAPAPRPPAGAPAPGPPVARLDDRFYVDSDGNLIPDFIEVELGRDPRVDDCAKGAGCALPEGAASAAPIADQNVLVILDASGSMAGPAGGGATKIAAAREAIERYVVGTPDNYDLGLMVYGHKGGNRPQDKAVSCAGIETIAPLGQLTVDSVPTRLQGFAPTGYTPIAASLDAAAGVFDGTEGGSNRVVLVTDGIETCDGDPVAAARRLKESGVAVTVDVVGFDIADSAEEAALRQVAEVTGGGYTSAANADQLNQYFEDLLGLQRELIEAMVCVSRNSRDTQVCSSEFSREVQLFLSELSLNESDPRRRSLIGELSFRQLERSNDVNQQVSAQARSQIDALQAQLNEAARRYQERYGRTISANFVCTDADPSYG